MPSHSRGTILARALQFIVPLSKRGRGGAGCALHPRSRVPRIAHLAHTSIQVQRKHSGIPRAMALRLTSCSSRWSELVVTVAPEKRASQELFASIRGARTTRLDRTQQNHSPLKRRVHRIPRPTCRDDGDTPLWWARDSDAYNSDFRKWKAKYFCVGDWTTQISLRLLRKLDFRRTGFAASTRIRRGYLSASRTLADRRLWNACFASRSGHSLKVRF